MVSKMMVKLALLLWIIINSMRLESVCEQSLCLQVSCLTML